VKRLAKAANDSFGRVGQRSVEIGKQDISQMPVRCAASRRSQTF
jgi:hypothetical protein